MIDIKKYCGVLICVLLGGCTLVSRSFHPGQYAEQTVSRGLPFSNPAPVEKSAPLSPSEGIVTVPVDGHFPTNKVYAGEPGKTMFEVQDIASVAMVYQFSPGSLYEVFTAPRRLTDIAFEPGEAIQDVAAGDTVRWMVDGVASGQGRSLRQHLLVKPHATGLVNSLVVTTNRRAYHLLLRATNEQFMPSVRWVYSTNVSRNGFEASLKKHVSESVAEVDPEALNFGYSLRVKRGKPPGWMPLAVFDDGQKTYVRFSTSAKFQEAPILMLNAADGYRMVNYRVRDNYFIIDRLIDEAILKSGVKKPQVVSIERNSQ
jgi:type IV secretion system protein TrbG